MVQEPTVGKSGMRNLEAESTEAEWRVPLSKTCTTLQAPGIKPI